MQLTARFPTFFDKYQFLFFYALSVTHIRLISGHISHAKPRKDNPQRNADSGHP